MSLSTSSIPFLCPEGTESLPLISYSHPPPCSKPGRGEMVSPVGTQKLLLFDLLETVGAVKPSNSFERTCSLALE